jgi:hypothetical protein
MAEPELWQESLCKMVGLLGWGIISKILCAAYIALFLSKPHPWLYFTHTRKLLLDFLEKMS